MTQKKLMTLVLVREPPRVLLGMKKRGFGAGHWNGFGGKLTEGESIEEAARREVREEAGIEVGALVEQGILEFEFQGDPKILEVHIFKATAFTGEPTETEEMRPQWFLESEIPYEDMWSDDILWVPLFLAGKKFRGRFLFDRPSSADHGSKIVSHELLVI